MKTVYTIETLNTEIDCYETVPGVAYPTLDLANKCIETIMQIDIDRTEKERASDPYRWEDIIIVELYMDDEVDKEKIKRLMSNHY